MNRLERQLTTGTLSRHDESAIGRTATWHASGRGRGKQLKGTIVAYVPPGKSNREALHELQQQMPELEVRARYIRFAMDTVQTKRYLVLVDVELKTKTAQHIYAPGALGVTLLPERDSGGG